MRSGIMAACRVPGVVKISAGNFEGKLGPTSSVSTRSWGEKAPTRFFL